MNINHNVCVHATHLDGRPNYRFYKLIYTAALRLKLPLSLTEELNIKLEGEDTYQVKYKSRTTYKGTISINGRVFDEVIYVVDALPKGNELITFWKKSQPGEAAGSKGGAHQFAEAYLGYLAGKMVESQIFSPEIIADELTDIYNNDAKFNVTAWIIQRAYALKGEPAKHSEPLESPTVDPFPEDFKPELILRNKWKTDVLRSGTAYTNYEVDTCIKDLDWGRDERIQCHLHWEDGKFIHVEDFGKFDRYTDKSARMRVFNYMRKYANTSSRVRLILTLKGDSTQWTLASSTMLSRFGGAID